MVRHARAITIQLAGVAFDQRNGEGHPCCHPSIASTAVMRVNAKLTKTERKLQDSSVRRATKRGLGSSMTGSLGSIRSTTGTHEADAPPKWRNALDRRVPLGEHVDQTEGHLGNVGTDRLQ